ncbi:IS2 element protein [Escherichia coli]|nr:IS2 element protein [Escherichia coli]
MNPFKGRHFQRDIILWAVRWYCKYGISYRELQEMLAERGVNVDHSTIYRWVQRYAPEMEKRLRWYWRNPSDLCPWHMDETYVKVNGRWAYLYRAVDSRGRTVDFYLSSRRNSKAAYRFLGKILNNVKKWQIPRFINTDKAPAYGRALALLKREGRCPSDVEHRQIKYRNNVIECDHGKLVIGELPTYGYRRVWALLRRQAELDGMPAINAKRVYRIMRQNALLLERKPAVPPSKRAHTGRVAVKESNQRWCSDGFEFRCDNGEKLRVTFALDCCDREALHWAVTTGGFNSETVQDVMLGAVERRFGNELPASPVEWLTDNGSCYRANETRQFARMLGLEPKNTAMRSPESNGIAESFVKTIKRDYISIMPKPDGLTAAKNLAEAFEHYNEWHPHSALGYRSPREYLRQRACNGLSDNRCLEI